MMAAVIGCATSMEQSTLAKGDQLGSETAVERVADLCDEGLAFKVKVRRSTHLPLYKVHIMHVDEGSVYGWQQPFARHGHAY